MLPGEIHNEKALYLASKCHLILINNHAVHNKFLNSKVFITYFHVVLKSGPGTTTGSFIAPNPFICQSSILASIMKDNKAPGLDVFSK